MTIAPGLLLFLFAGVPCPQQGPATPVQAAPSEQFKALRQEYNRSTGTGRVLTDAERIAFIGQIYRHHFEVAVKLVDLAEKYPDDPIALDALLLACWQVNNTPWSVEVAGEDRASARAIAAIVRRHIRSDKLGPLCERVSFGFRAEYEVLLRAVRKSNPDRTVRGTATMGLARYLSNRAQRIDLIKNQPDASKEFSALYGAEYVSDLKRRDNKKVFAEVEALLEGAVKQYGDVVLPSEEPILGRAKAELYELRNLRVGKVAPDINGLDQDGRRFRLSDYRGKVVLLDFWSYV